MRWALATLLLIGCSKERKLEDVALPDRFAGSETNAALRKAHGLSDVLVLERDGESYKVLVVHEKPSNFKVQFYRRRGETLERFGPAGHHLNFEPPRVVASPHGPQVEILQPLGGGLKVLWRFVIGATDVLLMPADNADQPSGVSVGERVPVVR